MGDRHTLTSLGVTDRPQAAAYIMWHLDYTAKQQNLLIAIPSPRFLSIFIHITLFLRSKLAFPLGPNNLDHHAYIPS